MDACLGKIVEMTVGPIFTITGRQIGYVSGYSENIKKLEDRLDALTYLNRSIQEKMDAPQIRRDTVWPQVSKWSENAGQIEAETLQFLEKVKNNNVDRCMNGLFPNIVYRYRLGREAVKKTKVVGDHETEGKKFEGAAVIANPAPTPDLRTRHGSSDYRSFESRKTAYDEIMAALNDKTSHVIGICGMGGVGKTTMVIEVGDRAKKDHIFDEVAMVVVSRGHSVTSIQKDLASKLNMQSMNDDGTESTRADRLCERLTNGKRILVILDDVWEKLNLKSVGIPFEDGMRGCKILLTTRNRSLPANKWIDIGVLDAEEAWNLFGEKMGSTISPDMQEVAKNVCQECGGLPIAINAVAAALRNNKSKGRWDYVLKQLKTSKLEKVDEVDKEVRVCLEVSYKQLESEEAKSCFLFCSLFPEDFDIPVDSLMRLGRGMGMVDDEETLCNARLEIESWVGKLKDRCLLLEGVDNEHVKMHDVVRDVAISIASEGHQFLTGENLQQWPQNKRYDRYGVISLAFDDDIPELPSSFECLKLHTIMLKCKWIYRRGLSHIRIPDAIFSKMSKLQVIAMENMKISSLPASMLSLDDLRVLCLQGCDLGDISSVGELKKLEMLILRGSKIDALPTEVGDLNCLKLLDLKNCNHLKIIPPNVLRRLSKLEELLLPLTPGRWCESANLGDELKASTQLESLEVHVPNLEMLPPVPCFPWHKLTNFKISVGEYEQWESPRISLGEDERGKYLLEEEQWKYPKILKLCKNSMRLQGIRLTDGISILLKRVEVLYLRGMKDLENFKLDAEDNESCSHLEQLEVWSCEGMQEFLATVLERRIFLEMPSTKLRLLTVKRCCSSQFFLSASAAKGLVSLQRLEISDCESMEAVIVGSDDAALGGRSQAEEKRAGTGTDIIIFPQLEELWLTNLPKLVSFYPKMKHNEGLPYFFSEPPSTKLLVLDVSHCCSLQFLLSASAAKGLVSLQHLTINDCENMEAVVGNDDAALGGQSQAEEKRAGTDIIIFPQLEVLCLYSLPKLVSFHPKMKQNEQLSYFSTKLRVLVVKRCCSLQFFLSASAAKGLVSLQCLRIEDCDNMEAVIEGRDDAALGERSQAGEKRAGTGTGTDIIIFPQLEELYLHELPKLVSFYPKMKQNEELPYFFSEPPSAKLRVLEVGRCCSSQFFLSPSAAKGLVSLQRLVIFDCENMEAVVGRDDAALGGQGEKRGGTDIIIFPQLEELWLKNLPKLVSFYPKMKQHAELPYFFSEPPSTKLRVLYVRRCGSSQFLLSASAAKGLVSLQRLTIGDCENMEVVVGSDDAALGGRSQAGEIK